MTKATVKKPRFNLSMFFRSLGGAIASGTNDLLTTAGNGIQNTWAFVESWLLDSKKARYGLAITRILLGLSAVGGLQPAHDRPLRHLAVAE